MTYLIWHNSPKSIGYLMYSNVPASIFAKYTRVGDTKLRVHQVSAFMIQNQGEEMIWFFT